MSDNRRAIAERHMNGAGAKCKCPLCEKTIESAMSEYTAAVLEEAAKYIMSIGRYGDREEIAAWLRARATQERTR